jgi:hypothetical protein
MTSNSNAPRLTREHRTRVRQATALRLPLGTRVSARKAVNAWDLGDDAPVREDQRIEWLPVAQHTHGHRRTGPEGLAASVHKLLRGWLAMSRTVQPPAGRAKCDAAHRRDDPEHNDYDQQLDERDAERSRASGSERTDTRYEAAPHTGLTLYIA